MPSGQRSSSVMPSNNSEITHIQIPNEQIIPQMILLMEKGHSVTLRLRGISMRPFLEDNRDKAVLKKSAAPKVGDVVLAETSEKHYVLHRIISICGNKVVLQGDGNVTTETCLMQDVHGTAVGFYRKGRSELERTDSKKWKMYSAFWMKLRPLRRYLLALHRIAWLHDFRIRRFAKKGNK